ncbi:thiol-disulfide oxidoreductase DCC family protein [Aliiroseovarius sp. S253]|uniref:thiol-disulfide oxidoreductase DCC family protein n=1 Tax=Aliiroseovarius sp. S253 TaxID=3415133 RepID=UPI003C7A6DA5
MVQLHSYRNDPTIPEFDDSAPVAVMDAECALCSWGARMIHRLDRTGAVRICPVQTDLGAALMRHFDLDPDDPASWLFLHNGRPHVDFEAVLYAGQHLGGWGYLASVLRIFPRPLRNWLYQRMARNRYAMFGRSDMCALPDPDFQKRLLP